MVIVAGINAVEAVADEPLTTKEGWRRFVDRQPHPPVLLGAARLAKLSERDRAAYDDGRRGYHADLPLVSTPIIRKVISTSRLLVQLNRNQVSARRGVIISGASGTGKTTALTQLGRTHELHTRKRYPADRHRLPVLYVTVPPAATARMLAVEFARFLGLEFTGRANITDIVNAVCATAAHTRVGLVCVDELHNLNLATRAGAEVSDQLKYFAERLPATFVYAGIDVEAQGLFAGVRGRQIAGRFTVIGAAPFAYGTGAQRGQWRALIAALASLLRLHRHRSSSLVKLDEYLYRRSGGMIGSLSQLVRGAAILAIEDGSEQITKKLLDSVPGRLRRRTRRHRIAATRPGKPGDPQADRLMVLSRLPIAVAPAQQETVASYLTRLANLHGLPLRELWEPISVPRPGGRRRDVLADRLAAITGHHREHLIRALPELHPTPGWSALRHQSQPGCPRCDARHPGGPVTHLLPHHRYVCTRHRYWVGPPDIAQPATGLAGLDDIVRAQRHHLRLLRRHGPARRLRRGADRVPVLRPPLGGSAGRRRRCSPRVDPPRRGPHPGGH